MKRLSQSGSSNFCPELRKNALLISQSHFSNFALHVINNGNCTEWSAIWSEIKRVITKSHDREAGVRFVITSLISDQNCTTRSAISTLLHSF